MRRRPTCADGFKFNFFFFFFFFEQFKIQMAGNINKINLFYDQILQNQISHRAPKIPKRCHDTFGRRISGWLNFEQSRTQIYYNNIPISNKYKIFNLTMNLQEIGQVGLSPHLHFESCHRFWIFKKKNSNRCLHFWIAISWFEFHKKNLGPHDSFS